MPLFLSFAFLCILAGLFLFVCLSSKEGKHGRRHRVRWVGKGEDLGRDGGREATIFSIKRIKINKMIVYKNSKTQALIKHFFEPDISLK